MKLIECHHLNFGSYKELYFRYDKTGLTLIHGATGSGKSTLFDAACWVLFGITAKNGSVDDIKSWNSNEATIGSVHLQLDNGEYILVVRTRGTQSENDLYWLESDSIKYRGKDITETQKLLNAKLGLTPELYCVGAYYSEFSPSSSFFTAKAKDRRALLETIASLTTPIALMEQIVKNKKETKIKLTINNIDLAKAETQLASTKKHLEATKISSDTWKNKQNTYLTEYENKKQIYEQEKKTKLLELVKKQASYEKEREQTILATLDTLNSYTNKKCITCGHHVQIKEELSLQKQLTKLETTPNPIDRDIAVLKNEVNPFATPPLQEENPFTTSIEKLKEDERLQLNLHNLLLKDQALLNHYITSLEQLEEIVSVMRGSLLQHAVDVVQMTTNDYLTRFFDSEIAVTLELHGSDELKVSLMKNGNLCNYKQLSKGQRGLLKLTFSLAIMKAASMNLGTKFDTIFLDESLDGLDTELKVKAFNLFSELETQHDSVLIIDHALELKSLFHNKYHVQLQDENSVIIHE